MVWTDGVIVNERESRGPVDGGTYRALVMYDYVRKAWIGTVDLYLDGYHYVATSLVHGDVPTAQIWCEAACLQLQRIHERLGA